MDAHKNPRKGTVNFNIKRCLGQIYFLPGKIKNCQLQL